MKNTAPRVSIIGGGLAGVEAAAFLAARGVGVDLYEMRPDVTTPAHASACLAELVCSNSFKGEDPLTAHGLLKQEMAALGSLCLSVARDCRVPAGKALAVDRETFARKVTQGILSQEGITLIRAEVTGIEAGRPTIIATGPLTSEALASRLGELTGRGRLFFYDAIAPIVDAESIDLSKAFFGSRWDEQAHDYLNCPLEREGYYAFVEALLEADRIAPRAFEDTRYFEGCLPIEVIAQRGRDTLRFGPMRPVGLVDPKCGRRPFALVQLRRESLRGNAYNLVGFQTRLAYGEQQRVFGLIPALARAHYLRYGSIHRNTFLDSPRLLRPDLSLRELPGILCAGQLTGVEGYMESAASGILAGISMLAHLAGKELVLPGTDTALGALTHYITDSNIKNFQPMNINFGIMDPPDGPKRERTQLRLRRAELSFGAWLDYLRTDLGIDTGN